MDLSQTTRGAPRGTARLQRQRTYPFARPYRRPENFLGDAEICRCLNIRDLEVLFAWPLPFRCRSSPWRREGWQTRRRRSCVLYRATMRNGLFFVRNQLCSHVRESALLLEQVDADDGDRLGRGVLGPVINIGAFGDHLAILIGPVRAALAVLCQATLHYVTERRTVFARVDHVSASDFLFHV